MDSRIIAGIAVLLGILCLLLLVGGPRFSLKETGSGAGPEKELMGERTPEITVPPLETPGNLSRMAAYDLVVSRVLGGSTEGKQLYAYSQPVKAGTVAETPRGSIQLPDRDGWFILIDDYPEANWAHPCRYAHVDLGGNITVLDAWWPPTNIEP
ncbi:MAG: hypothetical protein LUQ32_00045 [Methanomicrobiales archaeon]|nr:hypothetical protein [Methanomicrobiales archaeon]